MTSTLVLLVVVVVVALDFRIGESETEMRDRERERERVSFPSFAMDSFWGDFVADAFVAVSILCDTAHEIAKPN